MQSMLSDRESMVGSQDESGAQKAVERVTFNVLGIDLDLVDYASATERIEGWIAERGISRYVTLTNVHAVMTGRSDENFREVLRDAAMVCPDGMPLVWVGRLQGVPVKRVYGPGLMTEFLRRTEQKGYSHYFYGASPEVVELLAERLKKKYPGMRVAGVYSPPYRALTEAEKQDIVNRINKANPDVLWVGLGCPKQECWMHEHREFLRVPVMMGVGQAFDIHAGTLRQAPHWMSNSGLEWLFRLLVEPRRLWRRYLVTNTAFVFALAIGLFKHSWNRS